MRRLLSLLLLCAVLMTALTACSEPLDPDKYFVDETEDGWCILYDHEDEPDEVIVRLGSYPQPLVMDQGRFFYVSGGTLHSVSATDPEDDRQAEAALDGDSFIAYTDEDAFYCLSDPEARTCTRITRDLSEASQMPIPRKFRQVDYEALRTAIYEAAGSEDRKMRLADARAELDANGALAALELHALTYTGSMGTMPFWNEGIVRVVLTPDGPQVSYEDSHVPLSLSDETMNQHLPLKPFLKALEAVDTHETALQLGASDGYCLVLGGELPDDAPVLTPEGKETAPDEAAWTLVLTDRIPPEKAGHTARIQLSASE